MEWYGGMEGGEHYYVAGEIDPYPVLAVRFAEVILFVCKAGTNAFEGENGAVLEGEVPAFSADVECGWGLGGTALQGRYGILYFWGFWIAVFIFIRGGIRRWC